MVTNSAFPSLQANFKLLQELDRNGDNMDDLSQLATSLIQPFLRHHASKDVRLLTACCVAEVFSVFFPDPPYDAEQLKVRGFWACGTEYYVLNATGRASLEQLHVHV